MTSSAGVGGWKIDYLVHELDELDECGKTRTMSLGIWRECKTIRYSTGNRFYDRRGY